MLKIIATVCSILGFGDPVWSRAPTPTVSNQSPVQGIHAPTEESFSSETRSPCLSKRFKS